MLVIITLAAAFGLGMVYEITKGPILAQHENAQVKALAVLLPEASDFVPAGDIIQAPGAELLYTGYGGGELKGYIISTEANGYGGKIGVLTAIDAGGAVRGIDIYKSSETPGLGDHIRDKSFTARFAGAAAHLTVVKNDPKTNEIQAVTGATVSTSAVVSAVNAAIGYYMEHLAGGGNFK